MLLWLQVNKFIKYKCCKGIVKNLKANHLLYITKI